jgi:NAD(P)-dependent dehydrogenase (short-subunit alcohol dehydrogenase family)
MKKTVLITGASSGSGNAATRLFADGGWNVVATMRRPDENTLPAGRSLLVARLQVWVRSRIDGVIAEGIGRFGGIDANRAILRHFRANGGGVLLNVGSGGGLFGVPMVSIYSAGKFALEDSPDALSYELESQNIRVKIVEPRGGVSGNDLNARLLADKAEVDIPNYEVFTAHLVKVFRKTAATINSEDVAASIFEAATDGTDRSRYVVGHDDRGFIAAR